jgi:hypothetical protein
MLTTLSAKGIDKQDLRSAQEIIATLQDVFKLDAA